MDLFKKYGILAIVILMVQILPAQIIGPTSVCDGDVNTYVFDLVNTCDSSYLWTIDPPLGELTNGNNEELVVLEWVSPGQADLCVTVGDSCTGNFNEYCLTLEVGAIETEELNATICEGECFEYANQLLCQPGVYNFTEMGPNGCPVNVIVTIITLPSLTTNLGDIQLDCSNPVFTVCGQTFTPGGLQTALCTSVNGCDSIVTFTLIPNIDAPIAEAGPDQVLSCTTTEVELDGSGSSQGPEFTYEWVGPNGFTTNELSPIVDAPGTYCLSVTNTSNGCVSTSCVVVSVDGSLPQVVIVPLSICEGEEAFITATASGNFTTIEWVTLDGSIVSGANTLSPLINAPGTYCLTVTDDVSGCSADACLSIDEIEAIEVEISIEEQGCQPVLLTAEVTNPIGGFNYVYVWNNGVTVPVNQITESGTYEVTVSDGTCTTVESLYVPVDYSGLCAYVEGNVLEETIVDCTLNPEDQPLSGWLVQAAGDATFFATTDQDGFYSIPVDPGDYTITIFPPSVFWLPCENDIEVAVPNADDIAVADFFLEKLPGCPELFVDLSTFQLRRCFENNFYFIDYCNVGVEDATEAYVEIQLDEDLIYIGSAIPATDLGDNLYRFDIGDVPVGECGNFWVEVEVSCNAFLGQTHCTEAHIYPDTLCSPPNAQWTGADLDVVVECTDSVRFTITNNGTGTMADVLQFVVIEDAVMYMEVVDGPPLGPGETTTVVVPANGSTWRLELAQEAFHPSLASFQVALVEACGINSLGNVSTGFVEMFSMFDNDPFVDVDCTNNIGAYDPNDKQGFPLGYGEDHLIMPGTELEYKIRFQNTGSDTAFNVVIRDTLDSGFEVSSIRPGASSHDYDFEVYANGILKFSFNDIMLPDSNVNEPLSHGFVEFKINHREDLPLGTVLENSAAIYFDFNEPVITNRTDHKLAVDFPIVNHVNVAMEGVELEVFPNPFQGSIQVYLEGLDAGKGLAFTLLNTTGQIVGKQSFQAPGFEFHAESLPSGLYFFKIEKEGQLVGSGSLVKE